MTPEQIAAMVADREAGTPGPWTMQTVKTSCGVCHKIGPFPHSWREANETSACLYDDYPSPPHGTVNMLANASRIARVPEMETAIIGQAAEIARLTAERDEYVDQIAALIPKINREAVDQRARAEAAEADNVRLRDALAIAGPIALDDYANHPFILLDYEEAAVETIKLGLAALGEAQ